MRIDSIKIRNFRCFPEKNGGSWGVQFRPNPHLSLLVGPNGAGKTAILDALDLVLNAENRSNQSLITEYDFTNCDTSKPIYIEVSLVDLGEIRGEFVSDVQWIDPADGLLVEEKGIPPES
ncbi:MAG: ATP-binding protein, partial [Anaerovoracaceae bacterium]